jgi:hypothetical protein
MNVDKFNYMVISPDQNTGIRHNLKRDNGSVETVEQFIYVGTNLTNQILFRNKLRAD